MNTTPNRLPSFSCDNVRPLSVSAGQGRTRGAKRTSRTAGRSGIVGVETQSTANPYPSVLKREESVGRFYLALSEPV